MSEMSNYIGAYSREGRKEENIFWLAAPIFSWPRFTLQDANASALLSCFSGPLDSPSKIQIQAPNEHFL